MAAQEQIYRPSAQLGSAAALPGASAEAFGAGVGGAIAQVGSELEGSQLRAMRAEKQRQQESANAQAGLGAAQLSIDLTKDAETARDDAPLDGAGHVERVANAADARIGQFLESIPDQKVRQRWAVQAAQMRSNLVNDEDGWARGRRVEAIGTNVKEAGRLWDNQLQGNPDPQAFEQSLTAVDTLLAGVDAPAPIKDKLGREEKANRASNYLEGLIEKDPVAAKATIKSGVMDLWLDPKDKRRLLDASDTEIRVADADARRRDTQAAEQVRADASDISSKIGQGVLVPDEQVAAVVGRAQALEDRYPAMKGVADGLQYDLGKLKYSRLTDKWTSAEWNAHINPLAAKVAGGKASEDEQRELKILQELRPAKEARFKNDPDGFASASGMAPPQVDLGNPQAGDVQARKSWARAFARTGSLLEPPYLSKDQLQLYRDRAAQGPVAQFDVAAELKGTWGDAAPSIVRQIGGPAKGEMTVMLGLNPAIAQRYQRGQEALDKKAVEINDDAARQAWGVYARGVPADLQPAVFDAARKIAAGWMLEKGFSKPPSNFDEVFRSALQYAAGRTGDVHDFNAPGGLAEFNGRYAWLPGDMTSNDFLGRVARAQPQDWVNAAVDAKGNAVKSVPHYLGPDGKPKPYTKGDALRFNKGTLQTVDQGIYHLVDPLGHVVVDERGLPWTFDVRRLPRGHFGR
jgi:hypothetical protein